MYRDVGGSVGEVWVCVWYKGVYRGIQGGVRGVGTGVGMCRSGIAAGVGNRCIRRKYV